MWKSLIASAIVAALLLLQPGCSVIGLGIGASIDAHKPDSVIVQGYRLTTIEPGSPLTVTLRYGSTITGWFNGGMPATAEWIDTLYMRARSNDPGCAILPALGDTVEFMHRSGLIRGRIDNAVYRRLESDCDFCFGLTPVDSSEEREFCLRHLLAVRRPDGGLLRSGDIANAIAQSHTFVPYSGIEMTTIAGVQQTPLNYISRVVAPCQKHGKRDGLLIGAAIDVFMIAFAWTALDRWSHSNIFGSGNSF
jgi:hypothetical protein